MGTLGRFVLVISMLGFCAAPSNADVSEVWVSRYDGPACGWDSATCIAVDDSGCVYVSGEAYCELDNKDIVTVKYAADGTERWTARYDGLASGADRPSAMALDADGNVYVCGETRHEATDYDMVTIKYLPNGVEDWMRRFGGASGGTDKGWAIAACPDGGVCAAGYGSVASAGMDWIIIRYSADGDSLWGVRHNGGSSHDDWLISIAVSDSGFIYAGGMSTEPGSTRDYCLIKYDADGNELWAETYDGPASGYDVIQDVAVDASGFIYVTGSSKGLLGTYDYDYATIRYTPGGDTLWARRYDGPWHDWDEARAIAVDDSGNGYVTGYSDAENGQSDCCTIKYGATGDEKWVARYDGPDGGTDYAWSIAVCPSGGVYIAGSHDCGQSTGTDYLCIRYDASGDEDWLMSYAGPSSGGWDVSYAMVADGSGGVYLTGVSPGVSGGDDYATVKYGPETPVEACFYAVATGSESATVRWTVDCLDGVQGFNLYRRVSSDEATLVRLNDVMLPRDSPGVFEDVSAWPGTTFCYELRAVGHDGVEEPVAPGEACATTSGSLGLRLGSPTPNPCASETSICFDLPFDADVLTLSVYNVRGQRVRSLLDGAATRGRHNVQWNGTDRTGARLSTGVYFVRLVADGCAQTTRLVLLN